MKKINRIRLILIVFIAFMLTACATTESESSSYERFTRDNETWEVKPIVFIDNQTGVEYLAIVVPRGIAITPIYNADGSLKVKKNER